MSDNKHEKIQKLINELNFIKTDSGRYKEMTAKEIGKELRKIIKFEQDSIKKIEMLEKYHSHDQIQYARMICKNTTERKIAHLQEIYLKKIDEEYLGSR